MTKYIIYQLSNYQNLKSFFIYDENNDKHFRGSIDEVINELENDKGYHILLRSNEKCKFYIDLDKTTEPKFNEFCNILCSVLSINRCDISYTFSTNEKGASYHLIIPSIITTPYNIKCFFKYYNITFLSFLEKGKEQIDLSIYPKDEDKIFTLRLPNQTHETKLNKHTINKGSMSDFIIEYINNDNNIELDDYIIKYEEVEKFNNMSNTKKLIKPTKPTKPPLKIPLKESSILHVVESDEVEDEDDEDDIEYNEEDNENEYNKILNDVHKCLECIPAGCCHDDWFKTGTIIKNLLDDFDVWDEWSQTDIEIYKKNENGFMKTKWRSFKDDRLGLGHLKKLAKDYNKKLYNTHFLVVNVSNPNFIDDENEEEQELNDTKFLNISKQFEKRHCKIINKSIYIKQTKDDIIFFNEKKLKESYKHIICSDIVNKKSGKKQPFINNWIEGNKKIRKYEDINIYPPPLQCPSNIFNLWVPFECEKYKNDYIKNEKALQFMLNHIKILCNHEDIIFDYFIKWIGQMIQFPATKSGIMPFFISKEGCGKGSMMRLFEAMIGIKKVIQTSNPKRDITGSFNNLLMNAYLIYFDEVKASDMEDGPIKQLITEVRQILSIKGGNSSSINSYCRAIGSSQYDITTTSDDRRKMIVRCSDELIGNKEYFIKFNEYLDDINVIRTVYDYFKSIPNLDKFHQLKLPCTEYQNNLKEITINPVEQCIMNLVQDNSIQNINNIITMSSDELFNYYNAFITSQKIEYNLSNIKFTIRLKNLNINGIDNIRTNKGRFKNIDIIKVKEYYKIDDTIDFVDEENEGDNEVIV
jgi:hypothetical protein